MHTIPFIDEYLDEDTQIAEWIERWDEGVESQEVFKVGFRSAKNEALFYLTAISKHLQSNPENYYHFIGALSPATKGSGLSTVCAALYIYLREQNPEKAIYTAVNLLGSDTDTVAVFLGALLGAEHGIAVVPEHLEKVQDRDYLLKTARRLFEIARDEASDQGVDWEELTDKGDLDREEIYLRMLTWEINFHEMFWDDLLDGDAVSHPTVGRGIIVGRKTQEIREKEEYTAKLLYVSFDIGQTCVFHSRVKNNSELLESLERDLKKALESNAPIRLTTYRVISNDGEGWRVEVTGTGGKFSTHRTKEEAVKWAKEAAKSHILAKVQIYKKDGSLQDELTYGQQPRSLFDM